MGEMGRTLDADMAGTVVLSPPDASTVKYSSSRCGDPPTIKLISLLLHNRNFASDMNHDVIHLACRMA